MIQILRRINSKLKNLALFLQQKSSQLSVGMLQGMVVLFCSFMLSVSVWIIIKSIREKELIHLRSTPIQVAPIVSENGMKPQVRKGELERIHQFKSYLDSLALTPEGKALRNRFLEQRPRLLDTLHFLETLYQKEIK